MTTSYKIPRGSKGEKRCSWPLSRLLFSQGERPTKTQDNCGKFNDRNINKEIIGVLREEMTLAEGESKHKVKSILLKVLYIQRCCRQSVPRDK